MISIIARKVVLLDLPRLYNKKVILHENTWTSGTIQYKGQTIEVHKVRNTWRETQVHKVSN